MACARNLDGGNTCKSRRSLSDRLLKLLSQSKKDRLLLFFTKVSVQSNVARGLATPLMCCQSGERRSGLSLNILQLTRFTCALSHTSAGIDGRSGSTYRKHSDYMLLLLQLVVMRRNGYENSNRCHAKASFLLHGPQAPYNAYDSSARGNPSRLLRYYTRPD